MAKKQSLNIKKNEINFRRKLAAQEADDTQLFFPESFRKDEIFALMDERIKKTRNEIESILSAKISVGPYIEIGAERCQRALLLENEFNVRGFAVDLSYDMLKFASEVADHYHYKRMPVRISCDAYNLPFRNSVFPFSFCYQTLHHFPDPGPICSELFRILQNGGYFYINEEPVKGKITKYTRLYDVYGHRLNAFEDFLGKLRLLGILTGFGGLEKNQGILEEEFDINTWVNSFKDFEIISLVVRRIKLDTPLKGIPYHIINTFGGFMKVFLRTIKEDIPKISEPFNPITYLMCPECHHPSELQYHGNEIGLICNNCQSIYPKIDGIFLLFDRNTGKSLYPDFFA